MRLQFLSSNLRSKAVRRRVGSNGVREINPNTSVINSNDDGGILSSIYNFFSGLTGWISNAVSSFIRNINFTKIWNWVVSGFSTLWSFNWQATDEAIDNSLAQQWQAVSERAAGVAGRSFGYLLCGAVPGASMVVVNEALAASVLQRVGEEAVADLVGEMGALLSQTATVALNHTLFFAYKNVRKLIKRANKNPSIREALSNFIDPNIIDSWGEEKGKEWSFSSSFNSFKETLPEPWRDRLEEFVDEFSDACIEAGYVVAGGIDEFYGLNNLGDYDFNPLGQERTVYFYPDRDVKSESFLIRGKEEIVKSQIIEVLNNQRLLDNREIAINFPTEEFVTVPITENNGIEVTFEFYKYEKPPYWTKERRKNNGRQRITLTNVKRTALTFANVKNSWAQNFTYGKVQTVVNWSNGRKSRVYAKTKEEGIDILPPINRGIPSSR